MKPTEHEIRVFQSLSQSGEGAAVKSYIERLELHLALELIDSDTVSTEKIEGVKLARKATKKLKDLLTERDIIQSDIESHS